MRLVGPIKSIAEVAVPRWVGKTVLCARVDRSPRTIDNWMAAGRLPYRKLPSGMVRFRLADAEQRFGIGGLVEESTYDLVIVPDRIDATQLAPLHDVSVDTVREWVNKGIVPYIKNRGNKVIFDPVAVEEALARFDIHFPTIEPGDRDEEVDMTPYKETRPIKHRGGKTTVQVRWRLNVGNKDKRIRKDFSTQADAQRYAAATKTLKHRVGVTAMMSLVGLPDKHLADVVTAINLVDRLFPGKAISLADLVRQAAAVSAATPKIVHKKLTDALDEYLDECKDKMDPTWHRTLGGCLRKIARLLGDVEVHEVTGDQIEEAFEDMGWPSKTTWNHHRAYFVTFFKWAGKRTTKKTPYIAGDNPAELVRILEKNRSEIEDIAIPPPSYREKLSATARANPHLDLENYLTLTFELGLRTAEAMRLCWPDFNDEVKDPDVKVTASKAKSGATRTLSLRHPLLQRVKDTLSRNRQASGTIVPRNLRERRDELCRLAGVPWIQGVGRKSFATLFFKHTGDDVLTRSILGHLGDAKIFIASYRAADVIENNIRRRVTSTDAEDYFGVPIIYSKEMPTVA